STRPSKDYEKYLLKKGDILISHINSTKHLGKCAIYEGDEVNLIHGMNLLSLRVDESKAYPKYVFYMLSSSVFLRQLPKITKNSVNQSSFNVKSFQELKIPLPSLGRVDL
ncbi:restriction endonuclease subunit S, partial [Vibrio atlanticus]|uniref:restriction endonuclease subunit S n=1 Tax=Vibrio atlanticus TaxID=693153 RepID=UPI003551A3EF